MVMVYGEFGVFDGVDLLAAFSNDQDAEEFRADTLQLNFPEGFRRSEYDDLQVYEIPAGYALFHRLLVGLRASRNQDLSVAKTLVDLKLAQWKRAEVRRAA